MGRRRRSDGMRLASWKRPGGRQSAALIRSAQAEAAGELQARLWTPIRMIWAATRAAKTTKSQLDAVARQRTPAFSEYDIAAALLECFTWASLTFDP